MRLLASGWRLRLEAGSPGRVRWHLSVGLRRRLWLWRRSRRELRVIFLGAYLHWRSY